ncbi:hypothetical protein CcrKarma_gp350 [Caulobacter virus Karma]|uniref:hypothetical protein n=1 Tax=Caulobacter virus Karma TaxID=1211641 RepID=UPI00028BA5C0|nr:hypothetical protein CcrKarma_gp017 [Caulobacter virus Karma]YP_006989730.1 hypothetical protein CcrKarma_gp350 [Caulobacter virus Karma]AFU87534.1 hypothetical protein CcrKarma_gp017 [Caulobacter virus Karma]AFU87867.1 hypothetical protein CcrKarma_gp350 [Caulobacter virus Karma]
MALTFAPQSTRYAVEVPERDFLALTRAEEILAPGPYLEPSLSERLEAQAGVWDVEYNGHFGAAVYLTLDVDADSPAARDALASIIADQLAKAKAWKRQPA